MRRRTKITDHRRLSRRAGFALLVTITLLAFLIVLLVGLATYTRVETAVGGNSQRQAQARENARLALDLALAQLQRHAGRDERVTAPAENFGGVDGTRHHTGVWSVNQTAPLTWLVSGNETNPVAFTPEALPSKFVELVGRHSANQPGNVQAPLVDITASGIPGQASATTIGRYAWWVGDQGVKASVAAENRANEIAYAPYDSLELKSRLGQQIGIGPAAEEFEPQDAQNAPRFKNLTALEQLALLDGPDGDLLGSPTVRGYFHAWTTSSHAVLANSREGGLRRDLSLRPDLLGPAFAAWANYPTHMENPAAPLSPAPFPAYGADPLRRRHRMAPPSSDAQPGIAPILTYFYLLFGVRKQNAGAPYTLTVRWAVALWNPFSSALVPENLRLEISGLPDSIDFIDASTSLVNASASLRQLYGEPLKVTLPWTPATPARADHQSWLPGRVYNWVNLHDAPFVFGGNNPGRFYSRDLGGFADGLMVTVPGTAAVNGSTPLSLRLNAEVTLTVKLVRDGDGALLATYRSPTYESVAATAPDDASRNKSQLGFLFRMAESFDTVTEPGLWLTTAGMDPRSPMFPSAGLRAVPNGPNPAAYENFITISAPDRLFDRDIIRGASYNEDAPLFELPRAPILSLGVLQHFFVPGARPFAIGNSWGAEATIGGGRANEIFDRFFFSGLTPEVQASIAENAVLPNASLRRVRRLTAAELAAAPDAMSSKHLLQETAFNVNSTQPAAWRAMLRAARTLNGETFSFLNASAVTGTAADTARSGDVSSDARFFRFAQSAQEVFKAEENYAQSTTSATAVGPVIPTFLFRRGMRSLSHAQFEALAEAISANVGLKHAASGPFRSVGEFLDPTPLFGGQSAIEKGIVDANLNSGVAEFSSQWLTQGDVVTLLAPFLFARSDTFLVRAYGEAVNPATGTTEGRAWCEATVQRLPEYFDPTDAPETLPVALTSDLNQIHGRRFTVVSFRWLTRSDI